MKLLLVVVIFSLSFANEANSGSCGGIKLINFFNRPQELRNDTFVCLNPHTGKFGGFGNLLLTMIGVKLIGFVTNRTAVINHFLLSQLFDNVDSGRQQQTVATINSHKLDIKRTSKCKDILNFDLSQVPEKYGVNGCYQSYVLNPIIQAVIKQHMSQSSNCKVGESDLISHTIAQWALSDIRPSWIMSANKLRDGMTNASTNIDVVIQYRSWRDIYSATKNSDTIESNFNCHLHCSLKILQIIKAKESKTLVVFITSDNFTTTQAFARHINSMLEGLIVLTNSNLGEKFHNEWHSEKIVQQFRFDSRTVIGESFLSSHTELLEWILIGQANHAIYSKGSTFAATARMRKGLAGELNDFVISTVNRLKQEKATAECQCQPIFPHENLLSNITLSITM